MIWRIRHWTEGAFVKVQFDLGGDGGGPIRQMGEPTHTGTYAKAGTLTLYPEAWEDLKVLFRILLTHPRPPGAERIEVTIEEGT